MGNNYLSPKVFHQLLYVELLQTLTIILPQQICLQPVRRKNNEKHPASQVLISANRMFLVVLFVVANL